MFFSNSSKIINIYITKKKKDEGNKKNINILYQIGYTL